jgi:hypothetical protein
MTTKAEFITQLKAEYPTLRIGTEEDGYTDLKATEYNATISMWADNLLADEAKIAKEAADAAAKEALLKQLGITAEQAALLLS